MLNYRYLNNNNKIKKKIINIFIPMLFGFKNNKLTKTFYYENMYYKIFYLIFNHIRLIKVFVSLLFLKPNNIGINIFIIFFLILLLLFKYKTFFKRWIKPDHGIKFYFKQR